MTHTFEDDRDDELTAAGASAELRALLRATRGPHPGPDVLRAAAADVLPPEARGDVDAHLIECAPCRTLVRDLAELDAADSDERSAADVEARDRIWARLTQTTAGSVATSAPRWWSGLTPVWLAAAAGLVIVATIQYRTRPAAVVSRPPAPPAERATAAPPPAFRLPLEPPAVTLTSAALAFRAPGADPQAFLKALAPGLEAYRATSYADAARLFAPVVDAYPRAIEPAFYRGVSLLLAGDATSAVSLLERADALDSDALDDAARWFLAVARERAGDAPRAVADAALLCRTGSGPADAGYRRIACDASR